MKDKSGFKYVYNIEQAKYYISRGITVLDTGINPKTNKVWYKFSYYDTLEVYKEWCEREHSNK